MIEREIKLTAVSLPAVRARLVECGAEAVSACHEEDNQLWDSGGRLRRQGQVLRVRRRRPGGTLLTFKGAAEIRNGVKERPEIEVETSSGEPIEPLLTALGYEPQFRYQKRRETWRIRQHEVALDETPLGDFVEIEGPDPREVLTLLALEGARVVAGSYPELWRQHCERDKEAPENMLWPPTSK